MTLALVHRNNCSGARIAAAGKATRAGFSLLDVRTVLPSCSFLMAFALIASAAHGADDAFFAEKVRPLLEQRCLKCHSHGAGTMKGGLALDWRSGWASGGDSGPAIVPGKPDESLLITAVRREGLEMPPGEKLAEDEVAVLVNWVRQGAPDPRTLEPPKSHKPGALDWWSLKPLVRPAPPNSDAHPIDAFIRAKLTEHRLSMALEADRRTLVRRLCFDLHGLPPTPAEVEAFVQDAEPRAYDILVDRLLASPRYGERMARLWLDVAHYGESNGYGMDRPRMNAWPYRDYIIQSFNDDKPFARFVREQLAADALFPDEPALTPALGFIATGPFNQSALVEQVDGTLCKKIALNLDRDDMVSTVAASFLSLTVHCRPLPRSQVRPDLHARLLRHASRVCRRGARRSRVRRRYRHGSRAEALARRAQTPGSQ